MRDLHPREHCKTLRCARVAIESLRRPAADVVHPRLRCPLRCRLPQFARRGGPLPSQASGLYVLTRSLVHATFVAAANAWRYIRGTAFRAYIHFLAAMNPVIDKDGFASALDGGTWVWA